MPLTLAVVSLAANRILTGARALSVGEKGGAERAAAVTVAALMRQAAPRPRH